MYWENKRVLVTGASGFIGSHVVERLVRLGAKVRAFVHYNSRNDWGLLELLQRETLEHIEVFPGDLTDASLVYRAVTGCQIVFHLGALIAIPYSYQAPQQFIDTNVKGTLNVLQACLEEQVEKIVHTSTSETYGSALYTPIDEKHPLQAQSPYAASKIAADKLAESFYCSFDLPVATIRPFNTYGPYQSARAVIPTIISQALSDNIIKLGSLTPVRDLTFIEDTVSGFIRVAESRESIGGVFNVGTGHGVSINELVIIILKIIGIDKHIVADSVRFRPVKSEVTVLVCDNTKAREMLEWRPQHTLEQGLQYTIEYIRNNLYRYKPEIFNR
jgi:NAD dependent epimerase/dehydratase